MHINGTCLSQSKEKQKKYIISVGREIDDICLGGEKQEIA